MQYRGLNCEFNIEWHSISSGGKPTFPTCEFPSLEWYPRVIPFFHSFESWWFVQILSTTPFMVVTLKSHQRQLVGLSISRRCKLDRKDLKVSTHSRGWYFYLHKVQKVSFSTTNPDSGEFFDKKESKVTKTEPNLPIDKFVMIDYLGSVLI